VCSIKVKLNIHSTRRPSHFLRSSVFFYLSCYVIFSYLRAMKADYELLFFSLVEDDSALVVN